ncbi:hypothetical protein FRC14_006226 [Serendipita sp. 396]|nr:hypothetical protein FRC14_006226 [Serendipita sp. 396]
MALRPSNFLLLRRETPKLSRIFLTRYYRSAVASSSAMQSQTPPSSSPQEIPDDLLLSSTGSLIRGLAVYSALSFPTFVDASPTLLKVTTGIPVVKQVALSVVRNTFFKHFVGGESFQQAIPLIESLRQRNLASMLEYSVEVDEESAKENSKQSGAINGNKVIPQYVKNIQEIMDSIPQASAVEDEFKLKHPSTRKTSIAIKLSALVPSATALKDFSTALLAKQSTPNDPFTTSLLYDSSISTYIEESHIAALKELHDSLTKIGELAAQYGVRIFVDAEHTWYQPAIDAFATDMMLSSNSFDQASPINPVVHLTFQAYLRSTPARLKSAIAHATSNKYALGVKLVRGAYHPQEIENHASNPANKGTLPPVWSEKNETDKCYNQCVELLLDELASVTQGKQPSIGLLFGTHNKESCNTVISGLVERHMATVETNEQGKEVVRVPPSVSAQVLVGQLLGMADELTNYVSSRLNSPNSPIVLKCIPYGRLEDVMPYLGRRAVENKSVLGNSNTSIERQRISQELRRRFFNRA